MALFFFDAACAAAEAAALRLLICQRGCETLDRQRSSVLYGAAIVG